VASDGLRSVRLGLPAILAWWLVPELQVGYRRARLELSSQLSVNERLLLDQGLIQVASEARSTRALSLAAPELLLGLTAADAPPRTAAVQRRRQSSLVEPA
jgi:hypothetical protein